MKKHILFIILFLLVEPTFAGTATITIFGTNASNAQANITNTGNQSVNVTIWNVGGIKTFKVNVTNTSDTLTFNIYNVTANQVNEFRINGSSINGYQADSNGLVTFVRMQRTGNSTFTLQPAIVSGGLNWTWGYFQNIIVQTLTTLYNVTIYNATAVQGNGSGLYSLNASNLTSDVLNSSFGVLISNGSTAIPTGYNDAILEIPANGTITRLSLLGKYNGNINIALLYNASSTPLYPSDIAAWVNVTSGSSVVSSGLSVPVIQYGNLIAYVDANAGTVNKTNLRGILKRS